MNEDFDYDSLSPFERWCLEKYGYVPYQTINPFEDNQEEQRLSTNEEAFIFSQQNESHV